MAMLGPKATILGLADIELNRFALAALPGKTLAVASEQPADFIAATHRLNALISGEPVMVDRKYREAITIEPRAKVVWAMNELPRIKGAGDGIFRRVKVVEFSAVAPEKRDLKLKAAIESEAPGILNWAIDGLKRLQHRGKFAVPASVEASTHTFAERNDVPALFVAERCEIDSQSTAGGQELYSAYATWCLENGHRAQSSTTIANDWERLGFERKRIHGRSVWNGVRVLP
jgi:putative DNA primase/helicase